MSCFDQSKHKDFLFLVLVTLGAILVHGYHPWAEDAALYLPGVEKLLNPRLSSSNAQFFESHAHLTFFPEIIATSVRVVGVSEPFTSTICSLSSWRLVI